VEGLEGVEHVLQKRGLRQDGGAEVVRARPLPEPGPWHYADACGEMGMESY
jgi:hypothetical protein